MTRLLTTEQLARRLTLTPRMIRRLVGRGQLPVIRFGVRTMRFNEADVLEALSTPKTPRQAGRGAGVEATIMTTRRNLQGRLDANLVPVPSAEKMVPQPGLCKEYLMTHNPDELARDLRALADKIANQKPRDPQAHAALGARVVAINRALQRLGDGLAPAIHRFRLGTLNAEAAAELDAELAKIRKLLD